MSLALVVIGMAGKQIGFLQLLLFESRSRLPFQLKK